MKRALTGLFILLGAVGAWAQAANLTPNAQATVLKMAPIWLELSPALTVPFGGSSSYFTMGGDGSMTGEYRLPFMPMALGRAEVEYGYHPLWGGTTVTFLSAAVGGGYSYNVSQNLGAKVYAEGGATDGIINRTVKRIGAHLSKAGLISSGSSLQG